MTQPYGGGLPRGGELIVVDDVPARFSQLVEESWSQAASRGDGRLRLALSGGDTARTCYERLASSSDVDWARVECFFGDERCVPPEDENANQEMARQAFGQDLIARLAAFHPMSCSEPERYEALLEEAPSLDLIHLGLGPDGHTASLFPDSDALRVEDRLVVRNSDPTGKNPFERLTLTFPAIHRWATAVFTVSGESKREAFSRVVSGDDLPAARVRAGRVIWLCDPEALGNGADSIG